LLKERFRARAVVQVAIALVAVLLAAGAETEVAAATTVQGAQQQLAQAQKQLAQLNDQVERAQADLDQANRRLAEDVAIRADLDRRVADYARWEYQQPALPLRLIGAGSLSAALNALHQESIVSDRLRTLLEKQKEVRARDQAAHDRIAADLQAVQAAQAQAQQVVKNVEAILASARQEQLRAQAAQVAAQARASISTSSTSSGSGNHFAFGYCTWYVASRRYIPWFGNAIEWWPNARAYGYAEGQTPRVGAVMVTRESYWGHVAYVEAVNGDGSWTVSEMNFVGWDVIDRRTIFPGQVPVVGFIY
jgi:surface antigen